MRPQILSMLIGRWVVRPGKASQWPGMGTELLVAEPVFAATVAAMEPGWFVRARHLSGPGWALNCW
nr:hypothetical protein [Mycobacterium tuberculosis]